MKKQLLICFLFGIIFFPSNAVHAQSTGLKRDPNRYTTTAKSILSSFEKGEYTVIPTYFDPHLKDGLTPAKLEASWKGLITQLGSYKGIAENHTEMYVGSTIIYCVCQFGERMVDFKTVFNGAGQVTGLFFLPHESKQDKDRDTIPK
jgi:hypothetical protein